MIAEFVTLPMIMSKSALVTLNPAYRPTHTRGSSRGAKRARRSDNE
ncbi:hypothetical protein [Variovorax rhizosphaerae]|uniref:Uncharacterized protein n=1 Tax=Variovorax rhizosphaerae TaxID=1836200 RepID=A0ABU8WWY6_9BURK